MLSIDDTRLEVSEMAKMAIADQVLQRQDKDGMLRRALERIIQLYTDKSHFGRA